MSNVSRCRAMAAQFAALAAVERESDAYQAYRELERLWLEMVPLAESVDRWGDPQSKSRIYAMIDTVETVRRKVA